MRHFALLTVAAFSLVQNGQALAQSDGDPGSMAEQAPSFHLLFAQDEPAQGMSEATIAGTDETIYVDRGYTIAGNALVDAEVVTTDGGQPAIAIEFAKSSIPLIAKLTKQRLGKRLAFFVNGQVVSAPILSAPITDGRAVLVGGFSRQEATRIAEAIGPPFHAELIWLKPDWSDLNESADFESELRAALDGAAIPDDMLARLPASAPEILIPAEVVGWYQADRFHKFLAWLRKHDLIKSVEPFRMTKPGDVIKRDYEEQIIVDYTSLGLPSIAWAPKSQPFLTRLLEFRWSLEHGTRFLTLTRTFTLSERKRGVPGTAVNGHLEQSSYEFPNRWRMVGMVHAVPAMDGRLLRHRFARQGLLPIIVFRHRSLDGTAPVEDARPAVPDIVDSVTLSSSRRNTPDDLPWHAPEVAAQAEADTQGSAAPMQIRVFQLQAGNAEIRASEINKLFPDEIPVAVDQRTNSLIACGSGQYLNRIADLMRSLERAKRSGSGESDGPSPDASAGNSPVSKSEQATGSSIEQLRADYQNLELQARVEAGRLKPHLARNGPYQHLGGSSPQRTGTRPGRQKLRELVERAFATRQQLHRAELDEMEGKLKKARETVAMRDRIQSQIVARRIDDLLNPALRWDDVGAAAVDEDAMTGPKSAAARKDASSTSNIEGFVLSRRDDGIVLVSVGADDQIRKGQTLHVVDGSTSLGRVEITKLEPDQSIARVIEQDSQKPIRKGDRVTTVVPPTVSAGRRSNPQSVRLENDTSEIQGRWKLDSFISPAGGEIGIPHRGNREVVISHNTWTSIVDGKPSSQSRLIVADPSADPKTLSFIRRSHTTGHPIMSHSLYRMVDSDTLEILTSARGSNVRLKSYDDRMVTRQVWKRIPSNREGDTSTSTSPIAGRWNVTRIADMPKDVLDGTTAVIDGRSMVVRCPNEDGPNSDSVYTLGPDGAIDLQSLIDGKPKGRASRGRYHLDGNRLWMAFHYSTENKVRPADPTGELQQDGVLYMTFERDEDVAPGDSEDTNANGLYVSETVRPALTEIGTVADQMQTHAMVIRSNVVLGAALRKHQLQKLTLLAESDDPVEWLRENVLIHLRPNQGTVEIGLSGTDRESLTRIVRAVATEYKRFVEDVSRDTADEIVARMQSARDELQAQIATLEEEVETLVAEQAEQEMISASEQELERTKGLLKAVEERLGADGKALPEKRSDAGSPDKRATSQIRFNGPQGLHIQCRTSDAATEPLVCPGRLDLARGATHRLALTDIPEIAGLELFATIEVAEATRQTEAFLAHNAIPIEFTREDFDQASANLLVTKVVYLPAPESSGRAVGGVETLVSSQLDPGIDPVGEAGHRGATLAVLRIGSRSFDNEQPDSE